MLVLTRRNKESVIIKSGDEVIKVTIMGVGCNNVRIGFEASKNVRIDREEVSKKRSSDK